MVKATRLKGNFDVCCADVAVQTADGGHLLRIDTKESTYIDSLEWYHWYQVSMFALRADLAEDGHRARIVDWLASHGSYVLVAEGGDANPHVHALLECDLDIRMLRQNLRRKLDFLRGNGDYSLTTVRDSEKYERYICKGESDSSLPSIVSRMGVRFTDDWVKERHGSYWQLQADYKARHKRKGLHSATIVEKVEEICKNKSIRWDKEFEIGAEYLKLVSEAKKGVNIHQLRSTVKGVQLQLCPDDGAIQRLLHEAFPGADYVGFAQ